MNLTGHTRREIAYSVRAGHRPGETPPLAAGAPVPGCVCLRCAVQRIGGTDVDMEIATDVVERIARADVDARLREARGLASSLPGKLLPPDTLVRYAAVVRRFPVSATDLEPPVKRRSTSTGQTLPVEAARDVPILDACARLGLEMKRNGSSWRGPCPIHDGDGPNFAVLPNLNGYRCWTCGASGDAITLWQAVRGCDFPTAVREMAGAAP